MLDKATSVVKSPEVIGSVKVALYNFFAWTLDAIIASLSPETFSQVPQAYRVAAYNVALYVLVKIKERFK